MNRHIVYMSAERELVICHITCFSSIERGARLLRRPAGFESVSAYLVYDIGTELKLPERSIYEILGYRGYLYVAKTRYYATPEGKQVLEEALA